MQNSPGLSLVGALKALVALVLGAVLLLGAGIYLMDRGAAGVNTDFEKVLPGKDFSAAIGSAEVRGDNLAVTGYRQNRNEHHAMLVQPLRIRAANYPLLIYRYTGVGPGPMLKVVWRSASNPRQLAVAEMNRDPAGQGTVNLARNAAWRGEIVELGIYAVSLDPSEDFALEEMRLRPHSWQGLLASHWSDWRAFRGWTVKTINYIRGAPDEAALSPVPVAAAWAGLSLLVLWGLSLLPGAAGQGAFLLVLLLPWLALDLLWQSQLDTQLAATRAQFGGKSIEEQHLVDIDSPVYEYVTRLRRDILPEEPARILLLQDSRGHNFYRLRTQYYLLPHNVYNIGRRPPDEGMQDFDYVLLLGEVPSIRHKQRGRVERLRWKGGQGMRVKTVDQDPLGTLYQVVKNADGRARR